MASVLRSASCSILTVAIAAFFGQAEAQGGSADKCLNVNLGQCVTVSGETSYRNLSIQNSCKQEVLGFVRIDYLSTMKFASHQGKQHERKDVSWVWNSGYGAGTKREAPVPCNNVRWAYCAEYPEGSLKQLYGLSEAEYMEYIFKLPCYRASVVDPFVTKQGEKFRALTRFESSKAVTVPGQGKRFRALTRFDAPWPRD